MGTTAMFFLNTCATSPPSSSPDWIIMVARVIDNVCILVVVFAVSEKDMLSRKTDEIGICSRPKDIL